MASPMARLVSRGSRGAGWGQPALAARVPKGTDAADVRLQIRRGLSGLALALASPDTAPSREFRQALRQRLISEAAELASRPPPNRPKRTTARAGKRKPPRGSGSGLRLAAIGAGLSLAGGGIAAAGYTMTPRGPAASGETSVDRLEPAPQKPGPPSRASAAPSARSIAAGRSSSDRSPQLTPRSVPAGTGAPVIGRTGVTGSASAATATAGTAAAPGRVPNSLPDTPLESALPATPGPAPAPASPAPDPITQALAGLGRGPSPAPAAPPTAHPSLTATPTATPQRDSSASNQPLGISPAPGRSPDRSWPHHYWPPHAS